MQIYEKNRKIGEVGEIEEISVIGAIGVIGEIGVIKKYTTYSTYNTYTTIAPIHKKTATPRDCGQYSEYSEKFFLTAEIPPPKKLYRKSSLSPTQNLFDEAILRLVAVAQSGAYSAYVSICGASQTPKEPVRQILDD